MAQTYPREMEIGAYAVDLVNRHLATPIPAEEAVGFAMNIINAETQSTSGPSGEEFQQLLDTVFDIIQRQFSVTIDRSSWEAARFITHLRYLVRRMNSDARDGESEVLVDISAVYPELYRCADAIRRRIARDIGCELDDNELLYLVLHISRLCHIRR